MHGDGRAARALDALNVFAGGVDGEVGNDDRGAVRGESARGLTADTECAAGDDGNLIFETRRSCAPGNRAHSGQDDRVLDIEHVA